MQRRLLDGAQRLVKGNMHVEFTNILVYEYINSNQSIIIRLYEVLVVFASL